MHALSWEKKVKVGVHNRLIMKFTCLYYKDSLVPRLLQNANVYVVSSPDQIFCARPADSSKNRVWTLSLRKWQAVNWVIVGVNYIISNQQRLLWRQKICKLAIYDDA